MAWTSDVAELVDGLPTRAERSVRTAELVRRRDACTDEAERCRLTTELVHVNRGVAVSVAMRYRDRGVALDDLVQTAFVGLTKAVIRFDPRLADDLLTFAVPTIRGQLQRHFRDHTWSVRPPRRVQELHHRLRERSELLSQELGREPSLGELARACGVSAAEAGEALLAQDRCRALSLDQPQQDGSTVPLSDLVAPDEDLTELVEQRVALGTAVRRLDDRERRLLYLRFFEDRTQAEIGRDLGVSQMQVSRLLSRLLGQLREEMA